MEASRTFKADFWIFTKVISLFLRSALQRVGADGDLVAPAVFKTVCGRMTSGWLGSIPRRSRKSTHELQT